MKQEINRHEILEKITPLIENTAMRYGFLPIEIEFIKENHRWFLRIFLYSKDHEPLIVIEAKKNLEEELKKCNNKDKKF
jgi:ribosome maturation factor RimP